MRIKPFLRRCPFCGDGGASIVCHDPDDGWPHLDVVCCNCGGRVETLADWGDEVAAAAVWNHRADDAERGALRAFVRELAQVVEEECGGARGPFRELLHRARAVAGCGPCHDGRVDTPPREGEA